MARVDYWTEEQITIVLYEYCRNSLIRARNEEFSEVSVAKKWKKIIEESC